MAADEDIIEELKGVEKQFAEDLQSSSSNNDLEQIRTKYLGRKGLITDYFKKMNSFPIELRPKIGKELNRLKSHCQVAIEEQKSRIISEEAREEFIDVTLPGNRNFVGRKHPLTQVLEEIEDIFISMGFTVEEGPEVESEYYNFEALNTPEHHPSRDLQDTLYIDKGILLRTHTSPVQVRVMEKQRPPIRIIAPGRCFRRDTPDATHSPFFHQVEGLCVDEGISFADLKGVMLAFARKMFGEDIRIRFRPSYFPFTEPSAEYDFSCIICKGKGCRACKGSGWLEISGAGMVDPEVFKFVGYDSEKYSGYAFGMGVERLAMLKFHIEDIRLFYENDLRFLEQF